MGDNSDPRVIPATPWAIARAGELLRAGGIVAVPTETVYGLAARADDPRAVAAIYRAKGRPDFNPLIVHVPDIAAARSVARLEAPAEALAQAFWPGPLTMVLPLATHAGLANAVTAGLPTVAIRVPAHHAMRAVLAAVGVPLAAPSANRSGAVSPTTAAHVAASLDDRADLILDAGACTRGVESTIVALRENGWQVLRPGPVTAAEIAEVLGSSPTTADARAIEAPGQLASHYAPGKPVRLGATTAGADEFHLGFGAVAGDWTLSGSADLMEAAVQLYDGLHRAAASMQSRIAVAPIPEAGIGAAINDRLRRAAV